VARSALDAVFAPLDAVGRGWTRIWTSVRWFLKEIVLLKVIFTLILVVTGLVHYIGKLLAILDEILDRLETTIIFFATLGMTALVFLEFVDRALDSVDFGFNNAAKMALLLMLWVAFLGASLAARDDKHLTIDAADRALSAVGSARLYRFSMLIATVFSWKLFQAAMAVVKKAFDIESLAGLTIPDWAETRLESVAAWFFESRLNAEDYEYFAGEGFAVALGQNGLKLWVAELILPLAFLLMTLRFAGKFWRGKQVDVKADDIPARHTRPTAGTAGVRDIFLAGLFPGLLFGMLLGLWLGHGWFIIICAVLLVIVGAPLFVVIGISAALCVFLLEGRDLTYIVREIYKATDKEVLLAIPFFVMAGAIMTEGSIARRLINVARSAIGWFPGGLAITGVLSCMVFAAISGSSPVTVIAIGSIMVPALIEANYDEDFSLGLLTSAGSLGILIPPSIPMIIFAVVAFSSTEISYTVRDLFVAGIFPGILIGAILVGWSIFKERDKVLPIEETLHKLPVSLLDGIWAAGLPILILGGIYSGLFTATEAAAVSVVYALAVEFGIHPALKLLKRFRQKNDPSTPREPLFELPPRELPRVFRDSAVIMGSLLLIIVLAIAFNQFLVFQEIPSKAAAWVGAHVETRLQFLILVNLFLLALGCMMDILSAILIVGPLLTPIAMSYGINPVHFGIIFIVNLEIGYLTPPLGLNLFVASTVFDKSIIQVIRSVLPFTLLMLVALAVISYFPALSLVLVGD
jgi:C4-dicarboxylate transporter DctM subunit